MVVKQMYHIIENGGVVGIVDGPDAINQTIMVNGKEWRFDFDEWGGPFWLTKANKDRKCQNPNKKVWAAFDLWLKGYNGAKANAKQSPKTLLDIQRL